MNKLSAGLSFLRAGYVLAREGVVSALPADLFVGPGRIIYAISHLISRRRNKDSSRSQRLSIALNRLGPSWVKLGQFLATRPDVIGSEISKDLELLQDQMKPFASNLSKQAIEGSLGRSVQEIYADFSEPVAAASIAQVHKALLKSHNETVAVKVIRPGVRDRFGRDLDTFYTLAHFQEKHFPASRRLRPIAVTDMLAQSARIEMDLRLEAAALSEMAENIKDDAGFRVPKVYWEYTGRDCLTIEWINGIKLTNMEAVRSSNIDLNELAKTLMQSFLRHTLRDGFFHADMHPGNLFVEEDGTIVAVDMGIVGRLGKKEQRFLAEILFGFISRDYLRVARVHFEAGYVPHHHDVNSFAQAIRAIGEPIHDQPAESISMAKLLTLLFEITELFDMEARPELLLLQKTMVVVEGIARTLDPNFNMWQVSKPVVSEWISGNLGPVGLVRDTSNGLKSLAHLGSQLPEFAARLERASVMIDEMSKNGLRFDKRTSRDIGESEAYHNRWGRRSLGLIALISTIALYMQFFA